MVLFTGAVFWSSALLFLLEPLFAKMILPTFGGSPSVWNTSSADFFHIFNHPNFGSPLNDLTAGGRAPKTESVTTSPFRFCQHLAASVMSCSQARQRPSPATLTLLDC